MAYGWKGDQYGERTAGLGLRLRSENGRTIVDTIFVDGPAHHADISAGDELIALDGFRISKESIGDRLAERSPGERVTLTYFRRDELREVDITLGQRPYNKVAIKLREDALPEQRALYASWLKASWPPKTMPDDRREAERGETAI
jgi:predicted metalloprotease with PDZ domain